MVLEFGGGVSSVGSDIIERNWPQCRGGFSENGNGWMMQNLF
jgi:hypothetical protein